MLSIISSLVIILISLGLLVWALSNKDKNNKNSDLVCVGCKNCNCTVPDKKNIENLQEK